MFLLCPGTHPIPPPALQVLHKLVLSKLRLPVLFLAPRQGWRDQLQTSRLACGCGSPGLVAKQEVWNRGPRCCTERGMFARDTSSLPGDKRLHCIAATGFAGVPALECGHGGYLNGATDHARADFSRCLATRGG